MGLSSYVLDVHDPGRWSTCSPRTGHWRDEESQASCDCHSSPELPLVCRYAIESSSGRETACLSQAG